jgi:hypothetical protein
MNRERSSCALANNAISDLVRDVFGNPYNSVSVNSRRFPETVSCTAKAVYDRRSLLGGSLDVQLLADLAHEMESAGCGEPSVIKHPRTPPSAAAGHWISFWERASQVLSISREPQPMPSIKLSS